MKLFRTLLVIFTVQNRGIATDRSQECTRVNLRKTESLNLLNTTVKSQDEEVVEELEAVVGLYPDNCCHSWGLTFTFAKSDEEIANITVYHKTNKAGDYSDIDTIILQCSGHKSIQLENPWPTAWVLETPRYIILKITKTEFSLSEDEKREHKILTDVCLTDNLGNINLTVQNTKNCSSVLLLNCTGGDMTPDLPKGRSAKVWSVVLGVVGVAVLAAGLILGLKGRRSLTIRSRGQGIVTPLDEFSPYREMSPESHWRESTATTTTTTTLSCPSVLPCPQPHRRKPVPCPRSTFTNRQELQASSAFLFMISPLIRFSHSTSSLNSTTPLLPSTPPPVHPSSPPFLLPLQHDLLSASSAPSLHSTSLLLPHSPPSGRRLLPSPLPGPSSHLSTLQASNLSLMSCNRPSDHYSSTGLHWWQQPDLEQAEGVESFVRKKRRRKKREEEHQEEEEHVYERVTHLFDC